MDQIRQVALVFYHQAERIINKLLFVLYLITGVGTVVLWGFIWYNRADQETITIFRTILKGVENLTSFLRAIKYLMEAEED